MKNIQLLTPPAAVFSLVAGMWAAQAVATASKMRIPDFLADGPKTAQEVAKKIDADPAAVYRLLRGIASVGVLTMEQDQRFALTPLGDCLRSDVAQSMRSLIIAEMAPGHWRPWADLEHSVRTGQSSVPKTLGMNIWEYYKQNHDEGVHFAEAMSGMSHMAMHAVLAAYSFEGARLVVDVGGSHGDFVAAVVQLENSARGILFDRQEVIEEAGATLNAMGVLDRVDRVAGDFFESVPAGGDVYLLKHILHDWNDEECVTILKNICSVMVPDSRVVIVEMLITDQDPQSLAPLLDLDMLVMVSGKERTVDEFSELLNKAGLKLSSVMATNSPVSIIEARLA